MGCDDDVNPDVEIGMSGQMVSTIVTGQLATIGACGRQHKGVVTLVLAGATPGPSREKTGETPPFHWPSGAR